MTCLKVGNCCEMKNWLTNFCIMALAINLLAIVPLVIWFTGSIPPVLTIEMVADSPVYVNAGVGDWSSGHGECFQRDRGVAIDTLGACSASITLTTDADTDRLALEIVNGPVAVELRSVRLTIRRFLTREMDLAQFAERSHWEDGVSVALNQQGFLRVKIPQGGAKLLMRKGECLPWAWSFKASKTLHCLCLMELLLLLVAAIVSRRRRKFLDEEMLSLWGSTLFTVFFTIVMPVQTYLANMESFNYSFGELITSLVGSFLVCLVGSYSLLRLTRPFCGLVPHLLVFSVVLYEYLETGILAMDFPELTGDMSFFGDHARACKDTFILCVVMVIPLAFYRWASYTVKWGSLFLLVVSMASLFDVKVVKRVRHEGPLSDGFHAHQDIVESAVFSEKNNRLMFILDSVSTPVALDALKELPSFVATLDGFIAFTNNVGMHSQTYVGVAGLMTGRHCSSVSTMREYGFSCWGEISFLYDYMTNGIPVFASLGSFSEFGYTNAKIVSKRVADADQTCPMRQRIDSQQCWSLEEIVKFRLTPFAFGMKAWMLEQMYVGWNTAQRANSEGVLYPLVAAMPVVATNGALHVYHTIGCHQPFDIDRYGRRYSDVDDSDGRICEKACYAFLQLQKLFSVLRQRGLWDDALIVITADHGIDYGNGIYPQRAFPLLLVKPPYAKGPLLFSDVPTGHDRIATLMRGSLGLERISKENVSDLLVSSNRFFRTFRGDDFVDFVFDENQSVTKRTVHSEVDLSTLKPITIGRPLSLNLNSTDYPPIVFTGVDTGNWFCPYMSSTTKEMSLSIKVDRPGPYEVVLTIEPDTHNHNAVGVKTGNGRFVLRDTISNFKRTVALDQNGPKEIAIVGAMPLDGHIVLKGRYENAECDLWFRDILIKP